MIYVYISSPERFAWATIVHFVLDRRSIDRGNTNAPT